MVFRPVIALAFAAAVPVLVGARQAPPAPADAFTALTAKLEAAAINGDTAAVKSTRLEALRLIAAQPSGDRVPLIRYTVAYAGWRLAFAPAMTPKEQTDVLDDAEVQLSAAIKATPSFAEAIGLLSAVYGSKIAKTPDLGMSLGPRSSELLGRALGMQPGNPRLLLIRGQSQFNTPPEFGGSIKDAEVSLRRALEVFDGQPGGQPWPNWGRFDAHAWLGQALASRGDKGGARAQYEQALTIAPGSAWVRFGLLAALK